MKWEKIPNPSHSTEITRSRVPSGWLVCATENVATVFPDGRIETGFQWTTSITFVPDPHHTWKLNKHGL